MRPNKKIALTVLIAVCSTVLPLTSHATLGLYLNGYGAKSTAMGGVGISSPIDAVVAANINPAGLSFIETDRLDLGLLILNPQRRAECCLAPDGIVSDKSWFFIPNFGITYKYNEKLNLGLGMVGKGGGRTQYSSNFFTAGGGELGIELAIAEIASSLSYKIKENQSVAVSLVIAAQRFQARGLDAFKVFSNAPDNVTNNGWDWSFGAGLRLGWQGHFMNDKVSLGATYTTKRIMQDFDKYAGLFAENGNFDLPADIGLGISFKPTSDILLSFDWQRIYYEDVPSIGNRTLPIVANGIDSPRNLGGSNGPGFGWENQDLYKLGVMYTADEKWTYMAGFAYGSSPIRDENGGGELEFNVLAPATTEKHLSGGVTYNIKPEMDVTFTMWHAFLNKQTQFIPGGTGLPFENETIEIEMRQYGFEFGFGYQY